MPIGSLLGYYSGQTTPNHLFGKYGGITHAEYNNALEREFTAWRTANGYDGRSKVPADKFRQFIDGLTGSATDRGLSSDLKNIRKFNRAIASERAAFLGISDKKLTSILSSLDNDTLIKQGKKYEKTLEYFRQRNLAKRARGGNISNAAIGMAALEGAVTFLALYPYESVYLGSSEILSKKAEAVGMANLLNVAHTAGFFPDGTPFPSESELTRGVDDLSIVLRGDLKKVLEGIVQKPHEMQTLHVYEGLILHVRVVEGVKYWQLQQRIPEEIRGHGPAVRTLIAPGDSSGFGNMHDEAIYSRVK